MSVFRVSFLLLINLFIIPIISGQQPMTLEIVSTVMSPKLRLESVTQEIKNWEEKLTAYRKLYADGLISRKDMESYEGKLTDLQQTQQSLKTVIARRERP